MYACFGLNRLFVNGLCVPFVLSIRFDVLFVLFFLCVVRVLCSFIAIFCDRVFCYSLAFVFFNIKNVLYPLYQLLVCVCFLFYVRVLFFAFWTFCLLFVCVFYSVLFCGDAVFCCVLFLCCPFACVFYAVFVYLFCFMLGVCLNRVFVIACVFCLCSRFVLLLCLLIKNDVIMLLLCVWIRLLLF